MSPYLKKKKLKLKGPGVWGQLVEHLHSKCEALSSIPSTTRKKKRKKSKEGRTKSGTVPTARVKTQISLEMRWI
jgi:hypothetical protein